MVDTLELKKIRSGQKKSGDLSIWSGLARRERRATNPEFI